jgi:ABC-type lipoprotein export system ATPase subunit
MRKRNYPPELYDMDISVRDLTVTDRFGRKVLDDISLDLPQGSNVILTGPSGAGKSVLTLAIAGIRADSSQLDYAGDVSYVMTNRNDTATGKELTHKYPIKRRNLGFVPQRALFDERMTAEGEIMRDAQMKDIPRNRERILAMCKVLGILDMLEKPMVELSGGQQTRVMIASALSTSPNAIIMDEPTANLDLEAKENVNAAVKNLVDRYGITSLMVTHDPLDARRRIHMQDGRIVRDIIA